VLIVLAAVLTMGIVPVDGVSGYAWTVLYRDGRTQELPDTVDPRVTFTPIPGRCFRLEACTLPSMVCSPPSYEVCADPLVGDTSPFDGAVGSPDYLAVGQHWGQVAP
jgi:hypothetical protein